MSTFEREERYIVVKLKHLNVQQEQDLWHHLYENDIGTVEGVVIEHDWPIYEQVWQMVEDIVDIG